MKKHSSKHQSLEDARSSSFNKSAEGSIHSQAQSKVATPAPDNALHDAPQDAPVQLPPGDGTSPNVVSDDEIKDVPDETSEVESEVAVVVNTFALASTLRVPPAFQVRTLGESKGASLRVNHTIVSHEGVIYSFGGKTPQANQYQTSLQKYVPSRISWIDIEAKGTLPMRRGDHSAVVIDDKMVIYGGRKMNMLFDDLYSYDFPMNTWEKIPFEATSSPGPLFNHTACYSHSTKLMYIVGGVHVQQARRSLIFAFDMRGFYWKPIQGPPTVNAAEVHHVVSCCDDISGQLVVLGLKEDPSYVAAMQQAQPSGEGEAFSGGDVSQSVDGSKQLTATQLLQKNKMTKVAESAFCMVHVMDIHTLVWRRVRTEIGPESPLPFSMEHLSKTVLRFLTCQPHTYCPLKRLWYFPVNFRDIEAPDPFKSALSSAAVALKKQPAVSVTNSGKEKKGPKVSPDDAAMRLQSLLATFGHEYGMFLFSPAEMNWSLAPISIPKKKKKIAGDDVANREFFTLGNGAPPFEGKYSLATHTVRSGNTTRELLVLFGGPFVTDYTFALLTPALPARPKGQHAIDIASKSAQNRSGQALWGDDPDIERPSLSSQQGTPQALSLDPKSLPPLRPKKPAGPLTLDPKTAPSTGRRRPAAADKVPDTTNVVIPAHPSTSASQSVLTNTAISAPVVLLDSKEKLGQWVSQYYRDECKWMVEQRFATEKQFVSAKRAAIKIKNNQKYLKKPVGGDEDALTTSGGLTVPIDPSGVRKPKNVSKKQLQMDMFTNKIREKAVVGTLLFDVVDLHPEVVPRKPGSSSPKRRASRRRSTRFASITGEMESSTFSPMASINSDRKDEDNPSSPFAVPKSEPKLAKLHWAILRMMVLSGAAVRKFTQIEERKNPDSAWWTLQSVASSPQLVLNPGLASIKIIRSDVPEEARRVISLIPTKPVPYSLAPAPLAPVSGLSVSTSGLVTYNFKKT